VVLTCPRQLAVEKVTHQRDGRILRGGMTFRFTPLSILASLALAMPLAAQTGTPAPSTAPAGQQTAPPKPAAADDLPDSPSTTEGIAIPPTPNGPSVVFDTTMGRMVCQFFAKESPITVDNFIGLATGAKEFVDPVTDQKLKGVHFYDGTTFHRVIANFMIQGGDRAGTGMGDGGFYIKDEFTPGLRFDREGRLAMANAGPGTGGTQFFITEAPVPELNTKHTIFGQCDAHAVLVVQSIARVEKNGEDKPITPVIINKVTIVPEGQPLPPDPKGAPAAAPPAK
jgi:peptidyl-prolyl cis-trans isomerase A (cyclophilin A)